MTKTFIDKNAEKGLMIINGQTLNLFKLEPRQIQMTKLVRGLQGVIRFNGYSDYSVAQHSFMLSLVAEQVTQKLFETLLDDNNDFNENFQALFGNFGFHIIRHDHSNFFAYLMAYDALIHDFSEALTGDIIRPFKQLVPEIREMEETVDRQIRKYHLGLPEMPLLIDILDKQLATVEAYYLTRYYEKTLINELDEFQTRSFNSVFSSEKPLSQYVAKVCFGIELEDTYAPLEDTALFNFIEYSKADRLSNRGYSLNQIKELSQEALLTAFVERAETLKNLLETEYQRIKHCIEDYPATFKDYLAKFDK